MLYRNNLQKVNIMNFQKNLIRLSLLNFGLKTLKIKEVFPLKSSLKNLLILSLQLNTSLYRKFKGNGLKNKLTKMRIVILVFKSMINFLSRFGK